MVPPPEHQRGPQPYVPPVPPPPHRPVTPGRRRGLIWGALITALVVLLSFILMMAMVLNDHLFSSRDSDEPLPDAQGPALESPENDAPPDPTDPAPTNEDGMAFSADGLVRYRVDSVRCGDDLPGRSSTTGQYCVIDLELENLGEIPLDFGSEDQKVVTNNRRWLPAETPTSIEARAELWSAIAPGAPRPGGTMPRSAATWQ